ncbi:hypothetical protein [Phytomonospora endophytica]|uniref:Aminoglycoside phosphotransferase domain-containing protein n=1 Tax=Phytomonospora endophytica TaxID=714109 RepID=A0A841FFN4_9ACTN|nr:hypothetical protein [Phytomonospora endophytica]MBB6032372.1 hypothetical protein [Phytomonospora endophytica]GIG68720.1 hypothetical protein Pen01_50150 [Phytomonospora endophytica]
MDHDAVGELLSLATPVRVTAAEPLTGRDVGGRWSEDHAHLWRVRLDGPPGTAVVKTHRGDDLSASTYLRNEAAALAFLSRVGGGHGPNLLGATADLVVMEDLGAGTSLDLLLLGDDPDAAADGLRAFALALGRMHADTVGRDGEYYAIRGDGDPSFDRTSLARHRLPESWRKLNVHLGDLPRPGADAEADWSRVMAALADPGERLAFSNGDACPQNCRIGADGRVRLLDFDGAAFRHTALDLASLLLPFPACACWSTLPADVTADVVAAYREVFDADEFDMAVGCAAWVVLRAVRLPRLDAAVVPHPMGFRRRGQLLDQLAVAAGPVGAPLPGLAAWFGELEGALRQRWGVWGGEGGYPAFR